MRHGRDETRAGRNRGVSELERCALKPPSPRPGDQCGCRREVRCGAFVTGDCGIGGVAVGLMVGLSCRSGSIDVIWLQASHL
jgi:hypothetical protein